MIILYLNLDFPTIIYIFVTATANKVLKFQDYSICKLMTRSIFIYISGVLLAFILLAVGVKRLYKKGNFLFVPEEWVWILSLLSWVLVAILIWGWLQDFFTYVFVYVLFKYKERKQKK